MKWFNLKQNKCPKCNKAISGYHFSPGNIVKHPCGFVISVKRYSQIVNSQVNASIQKEWEEEWEKTHE